MWPLSQPLFVLLMQHALFQMGNRGCCVMRPDNGYKGDNSNHGTNAFYICIDLYRQ